MSHLPASPSKSKQSGFRLVLTIAIAFFTLALIFTLHRHFTFYSSYDQGIFNQVFWNGTHGRFFQSSLSSQLSTNVVHSGEVPEVYYHRLGQHFTPALLIWLPLYYLFPNPATLTVLMVTLITLAGLVLYALARQYLDPRVATLITLSYYGANAVVGPTLCNFHDACQIPLFVFGILLAMEKRWWWLFALLAVCILMVREDSGITLFGIGFYMIASRRFPRIGLGVCALSIGYMISLTNWIMPIFSDDISKRFMLERFGQYVDGNEASTVDVLIAMITQPWLLVIEFFTPLDRTLSYLLGQWLPLGFIPAIVPASWMIAGFPLLKLLLGKGFSVLAINIRYAMSVVPGLFYGAILWWGNQSDFRFWKNPFRKENKQQESPRKPKTLSYSFRKFWTVCICLSLFFTIVSNPNRTLYFLIPDSIQPWVHVSLSEQWQRTGEIRSLLAKIPPDASVAGSTYLIPHLSSRREVLRLTRLELRNDDKEVVKVDFAIADLWRLQRYQNAFKDDFERLESITALIDQVTATQEYGVIDFKNGVILLQKDVESEPEAFAAWLEFRQEVQPLLS